MRKIYLYVISCTIILTSCFSIKPGVTKTGKNLWEEFFVSAGVMQYFIKPLTFNNKAARFDIDFTFRNNTDSVTVNYSIFSVQSISTTNRIFLTNKHDTVMIIPTKTFLLESFNQKNKIRQSGKILYSDLKDLTKNETWVITIENEDDKSEFIGLPKTKKKIKLINEELFSSIAK